MIQIVIFLIHSAQSNSDDAFYRWNNSKRNFSLHNFSSKKDFFSVKERQPNVQGK